MNSTLVSIIEDHPATMEQLIQLIGSYDEFELAALHSTARSFLDDRYIYPADKLHILLLDIGLPGLSGIEAIPLIIDKYPLLNIVILSSYEEEETVLEAICAGACSYISKKTDAAAVITGLCIVVDGGAYLSPSVARIILQFLTGFRKKNNIPLSTRQKEILYKLADGKSYADIATELFLSVETIRTHVKHMYKAMNVANKAEAIALYFRGPVK